MLADKLEVLLKAIGDREGLIVAYSGGADSAFLAEAAHRVLGPRSLAAIADSPSLPRRELSDAVKLAVRRGWALREISTDELSDEAYVANAADRCYFCKGSLFKALAPLSDQLGWKVALGTNLDDLDDWRPGQRAAHEMGAVHPLVDAGFTKEQVREASRSWGLPTADKPAAACLASRIAYGMPVTKDALARIEAAEEWLKGLGYEVVRVRDLGGDRARVEVGSAQVTRLNSERVQLIEALVGFGFDSVEIDQRGYRRGSMNEVLTLGPAAE